MLCKDRRVSDYTAFIFILDKKLNGLWIFRCCTYTMLSPVFRSATHGNKYIFIYQLIIDIPYLCSRYCISRIMFVTAHQIEICSINIEYLKTNSTVSHHCTSRKALTEFYYLQQMIWNFDLRVSLSFQYTDVVVGRIHEDNTTKVILYLVGFWCLLKKKRKNEILK